MCSCKVIHAPTVEQSPIPSLSSTPGDLFRLLNVFVWVAKCICVFVFVYLCSSKMILAPGAEQSPIHSLSSTPGDIRGSAPGYIQRFMQQNKTKISRHKDTKNTKLQKHPRWSASSRISCKSKNAITKSIWLIKSKGIGKETSANKSDAD